MFAAAAGVATASPVSVFAAASTQQPVDDILAKCMQLLRIECRGVFAASSTLARQIEAGAPADIYVSANVRWMDYLERRGRVDNAGRTDIARNRLVVIAAGRGASPIADIDALSAFLGRDRIAVGDPDHVPAGIYAAEALKSLGLWAASAPLLLRMPNVRAALAVVDRGEAGAGIVYASDARIVDNVTSVFTFPADSHAPIRYPAAMVADRAGDERVRRVFALLVSDRGLATFARHGFTVKVE